MVRGSSFYLNHIFKLHKMLIQQIFSIPHEDFIGHLIDLLQNKLINLITAKKILYEIISDSKKSPKEVKLPPVFFHIKNVQCVFNARISFCMLNLYITLYLFYIDC